jgi:hypothetical protein
MPDTKFYRLFHKPCMHNYGRNNTDPTFGGAVWGGYMLSFNVNPQTLPNYPATKQVARSAEFKYNAAAASDPSVVVGSGVLQNRDVVTIAFNPMFNPMIIEDDDIAVSKGKTDRETVHKQVDSVRTPLKKEVAPKSAPKSSKKLLPADVLNSSVPSFAEMKEVSAMVSCPDGFSEVAAAVLFLTSGQTYPDGWASIRKQLSRNLINDMKTFDLGSVKNTQIKYLSKIVSVPSLSPEAMAKKSSAVAKMSTWLNAVYEQHTGAAAKLAWTEEPAKTGVPVAAPVAEAAPTSAAPAVPPTPAAPVAEAPAPIPEMTDLERLVIEKFKKNPRLMKKQPLDLIMLIPCAGINVPRGDSTKDCLLGWNEPAAAAAPRPKRDYTVPAASSQVTAVGQNQVASAGVKSAKSIPAAVCLAFDCEVSAPRAKREVPTVLPADPRLNLPVAGVVVKKNTSVSDCLPDGEEGAPIEPDVVNRGKRLFAPKPTQMLIVMPPVPGDGTFKENGAEEDAKAKAKPKAATFDVDCIKRASIVELSAMVHPPKGVDDVTKVVGMLLGNKKTDWKASKVMLKDRMFVQKLRDFDVASVSKETLKKVRKELKKERMTVDAMKMKSLAAADLLQWCQATCEHHAKK